MLRNKKIQNSVPIILSVILLVPNLMAVFLAADLTTIWMRLLYLLGSLCLFVLPALVLKSRTFFVLQSPLLLLGGVEIVHLVVNHATTSLLFVYTCLIAELGESLELFSTGWPLVLVFVLIWTLYFCAVFLFLPRGRYLLPRRLRIVLGCIIPLLFVSAFVILKSADSRQRFFPFPVHNEEMRTHVLTCVEKIFPIDIYLTTFHIVCLNHEINVAEDNLANFSFGIQPQADMEPEIIVLIIGETARYGNFGINGYERNTTPLLDKRSNLVSFDSVYSIANLTTVAVPYLLSRATPHNPILYYKEKSVADAFSEAGFYTAWIANQSFGNKFLMRISEACNYYHYLPVNLRQHTNFDINLLDYLRPVLADTCHAKRFVVLHSLGCHFKYSDRYPADFRKYMPDLSEKVNLRELVEKSELNTYGGLRHLRDSALLMKDLREVLVNSYDNAILYTDYFIDSTLQMLSDTKLPCVVLYIGDHGENLLDDDRNMFLHGTYSGSEYEYHVPMFIWMSDAYMAKYPEKVSSVISNRSKQISSMSVFHTLLDLGEVAYARLDSTMSVASPYLQTDSTPMGLDANLNPVHIPLQR